MGKQDFQSQSANDDPLDIGSKTRPTSGLAESFAERAESALPNSFGGRIRIGYLVTLFRRVGSSLHAGIDTRKIWTQESQRGPSSYRPVFAEMARRLAHGDSLTEAIKATGNFFPPLVGELAEIGDMTGKMDAVLLRIADHYDHLQSLRRSFLIGIAWPMIQLTVAVCVVGLLIWIVGAVLPAGMDGKPTDILGLGLTGTRGLLIYMSGVGCAIGGVVLSVMAISRNWFGSLPLKLAMRIPLFGNALRTMALARLTWTLSMTLEAGVDARKSARLALRSSQVPHWMALAEPIDRAILEGYQFHEAFRASDTFPDDFLDALEAAELSGQLSESMIRLSNEYSQRAQAATQMLTMLSSFAVWGCVAGLLILLIFRLAFFYLNTIDSALDMVNSP